MTNYCAGNVATRFAVPELGRGGDRYRSRWIQIQKSHGLKKLPQTEKAPMQIWFSLKRSEIKISPHFAFSFGNHDYFKGMDGLLHLNEL